MLRINSQDIFEGVDGILKVTANADWPMAASLEASGDSKLSKGVLEAIPLHLVYSAGNLELKKNKKSTWKLILEVSKRN